MPPNLTSGDKHLGYMLRMSYTTGVSCDIKYIEKFTWWNVVGRNITGFIGHF